MKNEKKCTPCLASPITVTPIKIVKLNPTDKIIEVVIVKE